MMVREEVVSPVPATRMTVLRISACPEDRDSEREALGCPGAADEHLRGGLDATQHALGRHVECTGHAREREAVVTHGDQAHDGAGVDQFAPNPVAGHLGLRQRTACGNRIEQPDQVLLAAVQTS